MKTTTHLRLSSMMFFEYFIWGVWYVTMGSYLTKIGFQGTAIGSAYSTIAWAAVISAFFVSLIADKYFSAEKLTGILHIAGGVLMYLVTTIKSPELFFWVLLAYALCYMPTIALTTTIGLRHCSDPGKQYPGIRVFGTIGWIAAGICISLLKIEMGPQPMWLAAIFSIVLGVYSFSLGRWIGDKVSVLCSDSHRSYESFAKSKELKHVKINASKGQHVKDKVYHVQNINNIHHLLKDWIRQFNGVSSGYLQNYMNWFRILRIAGDDIGKYMEYVLTSNAAFVPVKNIKPQYIIS